jgi:hypothetical protein
MAKTSSASRLRLVCEEAARGSFPPATWGLECVARPERIAGAVLAFTGHHMVAGDIDPDEVRRHLDPDDIAAPFNPTFLAWLGQRWAARVCHIDLTMARLGSGLGDDWLVPLTEPPDNERVRRSQRLRSDVTYLTPPDGSAVVMLGDGLADRCELSMEVLDESDRSLGLGTRVVVAAVGRVGPEDAVFATVAPGNTRSLRCLVRAGFRPIGAECLFSLP